MLYFQATEWNYMENQFCTKIERIQAALAQLDGQMENCRLCPRNCKIDRSNGQLGFCQLSDTARIYKYKIHTGEEPPISGTNGSGIIFFAGCTMSCAFCQNFPMSHWRQGYNVSVAELAKIMLELQSQGTHNINLVTPGHFLPSISAALLLAIEQGLRLPIVYNTNGYEKVEILRLLDGIIDIYLPDMKYAEDAVAQRFSKVSNYVEVNQAAVVEMYRQVGHLVIDEQGIAQRGLIIRHLLLPNDRAGSEQIFRFIAERLDKNIHVSLMTQYLPIWDAKRFPEIARRVVNRELEEVIAWMEQFDLENGWMQNLD